MVLHSCPKCDYSTKLACNFKRHVKTCDPTKPPTNQKKVHACGPCNKVFSQKSGLVQHNNRHHKPSGTIQTNCNNITIVNNIVVNNIVVNSFATPDLTPVVEDFLRSPAPAQVADERGYLTEALIKHIFFNKDIPQNRSFFSIESHGPTMQVANEQGNKCVIDKAKGLTASVLNVKKVTDDLVANKIIERKPQPPIEERDAADILADFSKQKELMRCHERAYQNKGELPVQINVPNRAPRFCAKSEIVDAVIEGLRYIIDPYRPNPAALKEAIDLFSERYAFCDGRWFAATGWLKSGPAASAIKEWMAEYQCEHPQNRCDLDAPEEVNGWELVRDPVVIQFDVLREMNFRMEDARVKLRESITDNCDPTEKERIAIENMDRPTIFRISLDLIKMAQ